MTSDTCLLKATPFLYLYKTLTAMNVVKPILKWVGGKTQIIGEILQQFPKEMNNYHEPFVGGGSVLFGILSLVLEGTIKINGVVYASDKNVKLICLYKNIQQNPQEILHELKIITQLYLDLPTLDDGVVGNKPNRKPTSEDEARVCQETYYYWIRTLYNRMSAEEIQSCKASAYFIFLNKTCFRGVYREGPSGFNVPFGHYKNPRIYDDTHILTVSQLLKNVVFETQGFETSLAKVKQDDFIYLDPPYAPESSTSFVGYTVEGFTKDMHLQLFSLCAQICTIAGVKFIMSNAHVDLVKNNFPCDVYGVQVIECKRAINSKKPGSKTNEVIIKWCN